MIRSDRMFEELWMEIHDIIQEPSGPITSGQIDGETVEAVTDFIFWGSKITAVMKLKDACSLKKSYDQPRQNIKKQRHYFVNKGPPSQSYWFFQ